MRRLAESIGGGPGHACADELEQPNGARAAITEERRLASSLRTGSGYLDRSVAFDPRPSKTSNAPERRAKRAQDDLQDAQRAGWRAEGDAQEATTRRRKRLHRAARARRLPAPATACPETAA